MPLVDFFNRTLLEYLIYIALLLFVVPIKYNSHKYTIEEQFEEYLRNFNKSYEDDDLYHFRMKAFEHSLNTIDELNSNRNDHSAQYGLTKFSDLFPEEFQNSHLLRNLKNKLFKHNHTHYYRSKRSDDYVRPQKIDWRDNNVVGPIINQQKCGACWAFAGVGMIESINAIKKKNFEKLSDQQVIDCAGTNDGCNGGDVCSLLFWMKESEFKVLPEKEYPLKLFTQECKNISGEGVMVKDYGCQSFVSREEYIIDILALHGPVAVAINAQTWQHYVGGVIQSGCDGKTESINHAVLIVGYDLTAKIPHYIIKNSWGLDFGEGGYLNVAIGMNMCGLAHEVSVVALD